MTGRWYRNEVGFHYGLTGQRWWLSVCGTDGTYYLDVGTLRIRWASRRHRPLFSERYGYTKWHKVGRLAVNHARRVPTAAPTQDPTP